MSIGRAEAVRIWFHLSLLLLRSGPIDEAPDDFPESESMGHPYVEVGPGHGSHRSG